MKKAICGALAVLLMVLVLVGCSNKVDEYNQKVYDFQALTLSGGADAESVGNMIKSVWYDTIHEENNADTAPYTQMTPGVINDDFNLSLALYFDSSEYKIAKDDIESNLAEVDKAYLELKEPPEGCEDVFDMAKTLYEEYERLVNVAINPTGSLQTYSDEFNAADTAYMNTYRKLERHFEAIEFEPAKE